MNARAAIMLHYGDNDWSSGQLEGLRAQLAAMGVEIIAISDAGFDAAGRWPTSRRCSPSSRT